MGIKQTNVVLLALSCETAVKTVAVGQNTSHLISLSHGPVPVPVPGPGPLNRLS